MGIFRGMDAVSLAERLSAWALCPSLRPRARNPMCERPFINAVLTRRGVTAELQAPWDEPRVRLVFGPESLDREAHGAVGAEVVEASNPVEVLDQLEATGCKSVLSSGGDLIFQVTLQGASTPSS